MLLHQGCPPRDEAQVAHYEQLVHSLAQTVPLWKMRCNLDPNADLDSNTSAPAATAPEAATAPTAEAPAATVPETTAAPANSGATESLEVSEDTTVDAFCKEHGIPVETLRRLNPNIPADGQLKGGTYLVIPVLPEVSF